MKKRVVIVALILALVLSLFACGSSSTSSGTPGTPSATGSASQAPATSTDQGPPAELTFAFLVPTVNQPDLQLVQDAVNKITLEKINATVKFLPLDFGSWAQQIKLMLTGSEPLDIMISGSGFMDYQGQVSRNQLLPLDDLLNTHGQGIVSAVGEDYLKAAKINGQIYGIPTIRDFAAQMGMEFRKDLIEKSNIDLSTVKSIDDLDAVFEKLKQDNPDMYVLSALGGKMGIIDTLRQPIDILSDGIGVLMNGGDNLKVVNWFETPEYAALLNKVRSWYEAGYVLPDAATTTQGAGDLVKAGKTIGWPTTMKPGQELQDVWFAQTALVTAPITPAFTTTYNITNFMMSVTSYTKYPEKAVQFLNLMYTDKDMVNLFNYGIEGKHYVKQADEMISYPEGANPMTIGYSVNLGFEFGNQMLTYLMQGTPSDLWKQMADFNSSALKSKALGFQFDTEPVKTEYAAVQNVIMQYKASLEVGAVDPAKILPEFISKLKAAGIDDIIKEKQSQLDAWAKANGVS